MLYLRGMCLSFAIFFLQCAVQGETGGQTQTNVYVYRLHARVYQVVLFPGVTLSQEGDGVWAYNRSDSPIFINSPTLEDPESRTLLVYRVPPGHCLNIFNADKASCSRHWDYSGTGPVDPNSVRISFAKGWGPNYSRQEVTACPCWLEVLLAPCR